MKKYHFIDTHCHIHDRSFFDKEYISLDQLIADAKESGVVQMVCVGTDVTSSYAAVEAAANHDSLYASIALHPHEAAEHSEEELEQAMQEIKRIADENPTHLVGIGECGLDYFYHSDAKVKKKQKTLLRRHLEIAKSHNLPVIFHVREAFDDFFEIFDEFDGLRGVLHSFTDSEENMRKAIQRGLFIGLNGIMTFTKEQAQLEMARAVPLQSLLLETDAPFLTPKPFRGRICKPEHVVTTAQFLSELRQESVETLAQATTDNAKQLFTIK